MDCMPAKVVGMPCPHCSYSTVAFGIGVGNASPPQGSVGGIPFDQDKDKV